MAFLQSDAIWTAIAERISGVNTFGTSPMPASGSPGYIKCDRVEGSDLFTEDYRVVGGIPNASIDVTPSHYPESPFRPGNVGLRALKVRVRVAYDLASQASLAPVFQQPKSMAQRHADMLEQALTAPQALRVTYADGIAWDGSVLPAGSSTGIVSGCLEPTTDGVAIITDTAELYVVEHSYTGVALITTA